MVTVVLGARPNFVKAASVIKELKNLGIYTRIIHTGQHWDKNMSEVFFRELRIPRPDKNLNTHLFWEMIEGLESEFTKNRPDAVLVVGDVNSTLAGALTASRMNIPVIHLEAGLRSRDRSMIEEVNRVIVDHVSSLHLTHCLEGILNLADEGIDSSNNIGNTLIDPLHEVVNFEGFEIFEKSVLREFNLNKHEYGLVTMHRPSNVDGINIQNTFNALVGVAKNIRLIWPVHPRNSWNWIQAPGERLNVVEPQSYLKFVVLMKNARLVITDSGGVQEETSYLGIPCLTFRENTEREITIYHGTNKLCGTKPKALEKAAEEVLSSRMPYIPSIILWDGKSGKRAAKRIERFLIEQNTSNRI